MSAAGSNHGGAAPFRLSRGRHCGLEHHEDTFTFSFLLIEADLRRLFGSCSSSCKSSCTFVL